MKPFRRALSTLFLIGLVGGGLLGIVIGLRTPCCRESQAVSERLLLSAALTTGLAALWPRRSSRRRGPYLFLGLALAGTAVLLWSILRWPASRASRSPRWPTSSACLAWPRRSWRGPRAPADSSDGRQDR